MDLSRKVYGIDLGTTYSCVAQVDEFDKAVVLQNFEGKTTTPSVVFIDGTNTIVGEEAKNESVFEPEKTVAFIKREIGVDESFRKPTRFPNGLDPVEISALILKKVVQDANAITDSPEPIKNVVITCPAYFGTKEREQTRQAGILAGLNVLGIINEPTAAAIAYGIKTKERKLILVYDLGGGTFDITLIRVDSGTIKVLATGGDHKLGGKDWDTKLAEYMLAVYNKEHGTHHSLETDAKLRNALLNEAEMKKKTLTAKDKVAATVTFDGVSSRIEITRQLFDQLTEPLLIQTVDKINEILKIAEGKGVKRADIDEVLLVGGSSRMPQVKARVDATLGIESRIEDPDQCVAKGAAIYALNMNIKIEEEKFEEGERETKPKGLRGENNIRTQNVTSKTYGVGTIDDEGEDWVSNLLFANTSLPFRVENDNYHMNRDGQTGLTVPVYESDVTDKEKDRSIKPEYAVKLDEASTKFRRPHKKSDKVKMIFDVNDEGILTLYAEVEGEETLQFQVKITGVRSEAELQADMMKMAKYKID